GALLRRGAHAARRARPPRPRRPKPESAAPVPKRLGVKPLDAEEAFPDIVGDRPEPAPLVPVLLEPPPLAPPVEPEPGAPASLFDVRPQRGSSYRLPERRLLQRSKAAPAGSREASGRIAEALVQTLAHFG